MLFPKNPVFEYTPPHATELDSSADRFSHWRFRSMVTSHLPTSRRQSIGSKEHCMFNKCALLITGLLMTVSSVGCCCLGGGAYGAGYGMNRCAPCNNGCSPAGGYIPSTTQLYQTDMSQTAFAPAGYTQSAFVPTQTATVIPGAIQGAPIYQQAIVPVNSLPPY
jgi:hypothetical protein